LNAKSREVNLDPTRIEEYPQPAPTFLLTEEAMTFCGIRAHRGLLLTSLLTLAGCTEGQYPQTTFEPVTDFGRLLNGLFANTFWWTIGIMLLVEVLILIFIFRYRERPGAPNPKQIHGHTGLEIAWTIIPAVIVLFIAVPTVGGIFATDGGGARDDALQVEVIGHQWWWEFRYPQLGVITANELVLPVGRQVQLKMWSADVIHSYWIPRIGGKRDVNPQPRATKEERAKYNYLLFNIDEPGYYLGQCAEFCGASHAVMRTSALALSETEFAQWARSMGGQMPVVPVSAAQERQHGETSAEKIPGTEPGSREGGAAGPPRDTLDTRDTLRASPQTPAPIPAAGQSRAPVNALSPTGAPAPGRGTYQELGQIPPGSAQLSALTPGQPSLEERGMQLFTTKACVACHAIAGTTARGQIGPNLTRFGARRYLAAGARPNTVENLVAWIHDPKSIKPGALMPGTREGAAGMPATGLSDEEVKAVAAYLHSLK
jgi:cytochrome c oxidase subunit 2